jgi:hypothetical protein
MIPSFRKEIMETEDKSFDKTPKEDNLLYQLKVSLIKALFFYFFLI